MFGMEYILAAMKMLVNIAFAIVTAIPFVIAWNCVTPKYLSFLPEVYHYIPYWHVVAIILVCRYVGELITMLVPTIVSISQTDNTQIPGK